MALTLGGCPMFAVFIDIDAELQDGLVRFANPDQGWFGSHCVRHLEVTRSGTGEIMWAGSAKGSECLVHMPFDYGERLTNPKPGEFLTAKDMEPGESYVIFVELDNGAGEGSFRIGEDGTPFNTD